MNRFMGYPCWKWVALFNFEATSREAFSHSLGQERSHAAVALAVSCCWRVPSSFMTDEQSALIRGYFACAASLLDAQMVRSDKILGDLAEWMCVQRYGLVLETSGRHPGYDGVIGERKVQVKAHNSPQGTNLSVGNPGQYDELFVLIGPRSRLRLGPAGQTFHVYRFTARHVEENFRHLSGCYCAKKELTGRTYDVIDVG